jgi:predicted nucleotidyltransferase
MGIKELLTERRDDIIKIAERHGATNIRVFGSVARGDAGSESDIDFLVRLEAGTTLLNHAALIRELRSLLGCKVDVVSERGLRNRIRDRVMQEAVPL